MSLAHLRVTNGTDHVDLIGGPFYLTDSVIGMPGLKGGGVFIDSPLADGRRLAYSVFANAQDRYDFMQSSEDGDVADDELNSLATLLVQAGNHWKTNGRIGPVWMEIKSAQHTNTKYGRIVVGTIEGMGNQFSNPYLQTNCTVLEDELVLLIERRNWKSAAPGSVENLSTENNDYQLNVVQDPSLEKYQQGGPWAELGSPDSTAQATDIVYDGEYSVRITDSGSNDGIYVDVEDLDPADSITITAFVYVVSDTARLQIYDGGGTSNGVSDTTSTTGVWTQLSVTKNIPASGDIRVALEAVGSTADIRVDDVEAFLNFGPGSGDTTAASISNGHGESHITHILTSDSGSFSSNLLWDSLPYNLLPSTPTASDFVYFGSATNHGGGGQFGNIVLNLSAVADLTLVWEYYNGSSWISLDVFDGSEDFSVAGKSVVGWHLPTNWAAHTPAGQSVEAFWMRANVGTYSGGGTVTQQTYHPYTVASNAVEVPALNITGDYDPPLRITISPESLPVKVFSEEFLSAGEDTNGGDGDSSSATTPSLVLDNSTVQMGQDHLIEVRFDDVDIPQGAIINGAYLYGMTAGGSGGTDTANYFVKVELSDDAGELQTGENPLVPGRVFSSDTQAFFSLYGPWWEFINGISFPLVSVRDQVREITERSGWVSGNAMNFLIKDSAVTGGEYRTFSMYENNPLSWKLRVDWIDPSSFSSGFVIGARSTNRGSDFRSNINLSPDQTDAISVTAATASFRDASNYSGPLRGLSNLAAHVVEGTVANYGVMTDRVTVRISPKMSQSFSGSFRAFVRVQHQILNSTPTSIRLRYSPTGSYSASDAVFSNISTVAVAQYPELVDLGTVTIPETSNPSGSPISFTIQTAAPDGRAYQLLDLVLIPSDEWICEVGAPSNIGAVLEGTRSLIIDGVDQTDGLVAEVVTDRGRVKWAASGAIAKLERNNAIKLWMLSLSDLSIAGDELQAHRGSFSNFIHSVSLTFVREFLLGRGS